MSSASGPGKTAPKLLNDFLCFDPLKCSPTSNCLSDYTPPVGEGQQLGPGIASCKHEYTTKREQSLTPPLDVRPDGGSEYKVAVVCRKCRIHADVYIAYPDASDPCPNGEFPLHHFQRHGAGDFKGSDRIVYGWQCSAPQCRAWLRITFRTSRISPAERDLLTNTEALKSRFKDEVEDNPEREGIKQATPMDALGRLRKYITDSLNPEQEKRSFPANNKRFQEAFGMRGRVHSCERLLEKLGFTYEVRWSCECGTWIVRLILRLAG